jgi:hypothetical protein
MELVDIQDSVLRRRLGASFGKAGGRFVRVGSHLYAAGDEPLLESTFDNPVFEEVQDVFNTYQSNPQVFDEIELSEFPGETAIAETTPLLNTGISSGIVAGGASTAAPSSTAIAAGVGVGVATLGAGIAIGLSGGATLPGHKYIGPGNDENSGTPVDTDDAIAQAHDIAYANAKTQQDVINADTDAIAQFDHDWNSNTNFHSLAGRTGLQIKKTIEGYTGVIYPSSLPTGEQWANIHLIKVHMTTKNLDKDLGNLQAKGGIGLGIFGINGIVTDLRRLDVLEDHFQG